MQCCLEQFQHFLSRLITLYITSTNNNNNSNHATAGVSETERPPRPSKMDTLKVGVGAVMTTKQEDDQEWGLEQRECMAAFAAACQIFLECSSFPIYIAEGNMKASPTREELAGEETHLCQVK